MARRAFQNPATEDERINKPIRKWPPVPPSAIALAYKNPCALQYTDDMPQRVLDILNTGTTHTSVDIARIFGTTAQRLEYFRKLDVNFEAAMRMADEYHKNRIVVSIIDGTATSQAMFLLKCVYGMVESDKLRLVELQEKEFAARIAGKISAKPTEGIQVNFVEVSNDATVIEAEVLP